MIHLLKIISSFITLPGLFLTVFLLMFAFYFKKRKKLSFLFLSFALVFYFLTSNWFAYLISKTLVLKDTEDNGTFIVVLGGGVDEFSNNVEIGKHTLRRLYKALELYKKKPRSIIVTGGIIDKGVSEALVMKNVLLNLGIPEEDIILESKARNTFENGKYTFELIGDVSITLVTSAIHMKRSLFVFRKFFKDISFVSADVPVDFRNSYLDYIPNANAFYSTCNFSHELFGMIQYKLLYAK